MTAVLESWPCAWCDAPLHSWELEEHASACSCIHFKEKRKRKEAKTATCAMCDGKPRGFGVPCTACGGKGSVEV